MTPALKTRWQIATKTKSITVVSLQIELCYKVRLVRTDSHLAWRSHLQDKTKIPWESRLIVCNI